ncbi:MAG: TetR family transcriptional regulator [Dermatophilaceae bacterium]
MSEPQGRRERRKRETRRDISRAAVALFADRGFDGVTMLEIAAAADVAPRTLFRYFPDKEELLFADEHVVDTHLREALAARPVDEPPSITTRAALAEIAALWTDRRDEGRRRRSIIEASPALQARDRLKHAAHEREIADGLQLRGVPAHRSRLLARLAVSCFDEAVVRWLADETAPLDTVVDATFAEAGSLWTETGDTGR